MWSIFTNRKGVFEKNNQKTESIGVVETIGNFENISS